MSASDWKRVNLLAYATALLVFVAVGLGYWADRTRPVHPPRWEPERFAAIVPEAQGRARERWVVAVNLRCPHCLEHLRALSDTLAFRPRPARLTALIVDASQRPVNVSLEARLDGGVWWDSSQVWRERWGRRVYGETFRFDARGRILGSTPSGAVPDHLVPD